MRNIFIQSWLLFFTATYRVPEIVVYFSITHLEVHVLHWKVPFNATRYWIKVLLMTWDNYLRNKVNGEKVFMPGLV